MKSCCPGQMKARGQGKEEIRRRKGEEPGLEILEGSFRLHAATDGIMYPTNRLPYWDIQCPLYSQT